MNTPETMEERFDHRTELCSHDGGFKYCIYEDFHEEYESGDFDVDLIKSFIKEEISLAISSHNKELVEKVEKMKKEGYAQYMASEKKHLERINFNEALDQVINLIKDSK